MSAPGATYAVIDLEHARRRQSVAACVLETREGPVVVDPGPASTLQRLRAGLAEHGHSVGDLAAVLLTHIHLDHAGASGTLARENPRLRVYVHEVGAPHIVDPSKLLASATRLYGGKMQELWGEVAPVPIERTVALKGGERLALGDRTIEVASTPGHAWHHVSYFEPSRGTAFVGDTAGLRTPSMPWVLPVTPPPEFDLEAWLVSIDRILEWDPAEIVLTHYGAWSDPRGHFDALREGLVTWAGLARDTLSAGGTDAEQAAEFVARLEMWSRGKVPSRQAKRFLAGAAPEACWNGLARYWRKKDGKAEGRKDRA